jgi:hypothetical protein
MSHSPACVFCWPHQPELPAAFLLRVLASCVLAVLRAGCWCLPVLAHWCLRSARRAFDLGLAHQNDLKKTAAKKAMPFTFYGGWRAGRRPPSRALPAAACSLLAVLLLQLLQLLQLLLKPLLLLLLLGLYYCSLLLPCLLPAPPSSLLALLLFAVPSSPPPPAPSPPPVPSSSSPPVPLLLLLIPRLWKVKRGPRKSSHLPKHLHHRMEAGVDATRSGLL